MKTVSFCLLFIHCDLVPLELSFYWLSLDPWLSGMEIELFQIFIESNSKEIQKNCGDEEGVVKGATGFWWVDGPILKPVVLFLECLLMLKVVLVLKQVVIRLKECELDVVVRKKNANLPLCTHCKVSNGFASVNTTTQFYVHSDDPTLHMQLILYLGAERKMGGQVKLTITDWEPNVIHNNISQLLNSPDKQGRLAFKFYYFQEEGVIDKRPIFLCSDRHHSLYEDIKKQKDQLTNENSLLEQQLANESSRNQELEGAKKRLMREEEAGWEELHRSNLLLCQANINDNAQKWETSREMARQLDLLLTKGAIHPKKNQQ